MKNSVVLTCCIVIGMLLLNHAEAGQNVKNLSAEIEAASALLLNHSNDKKEMEKGFLDLVSALSRMAAEEFDLPAGFKTKIVAAHSHFRENSFLDRDGIEALHGAFEILSSGKEFAFPEDLSNIDDIIEHARLKIQNGLRALRQGQSDQAAREILSITLMIVTPVRKPV